MGAGADLVVRIATKGAGLAKTQIDRLGKSGTLAGSKLATFAKIGVGAVAGALVGITKGLIESAQAFVSFEDKLNQSLAIMDTTVEQQNAMAEAARQVATETTISADQSAEAFFFLASAGLDAEQSIAALPQVAKFAQAGMFDMATATDLATDAQSALGLSVDDAQENLHNLSRVTDVLVKANTLANASVQQFSEALTTKAGAALKVVNKDVEEGVAVLAAFADRGVKGAEGGEKLNQVLRDIPRATAKNTEAFAALGLEMFDNEGKMKNVADIVEELDSVLGPMSDEMKAATLDQLGLNRGVADAVKILSGSTEQIREYEAALREAGGTTEMVAQKQLESLKAQAQILKNTMNNLAITIGSDLAPVMEKSIQFFKTLTDRIVKFKEGVDNGTKSTKGLKVAAAFVVAALAPLAPVATAVALAIGAIVKIVGKGNEDFRKQEELGKRVNNVYNRMTNQYRRTKESVTEVVEVSRSLEEILDGTQFTVAELTREFDANGIALDENAKEALKTAEAYEDGLLGGMQSVLSAMDRMQSIQDKVANAEKKRNKAVEQQMKAEEDVAKATDNLDKAKQKLIDVQGKGLAVTLEEQLAIERQKESIRQLKAQEELSVIQKLELQLAEERLIELIAESTALSREEEDALKAVERAEKDLTRAEDLRTSAIDKVNEAQKELNKTTEASFRNILEQAIATEELNNALGNFGEGTKAFEDAMAKMSRITGTEIDKIIASFQRLNSNTPSDFNFAPKGGGDTPGDEIIDGSVEFPASGGAAVPDPEFGKDSALARHGTTNIITVNPQAILGTPSEIEDAVARAIQEGARRGINVVF